MYGKYIYGIIIDSGTLGLGVRGVDDASLVYTISHQGLSCVASNYSGGEFASMSKGEVAPCLLAHQVVVEQVMRRRAVLPVKFGTVLTTSEEVCQMLSQGHSQFLFTLTWIQDKVEVEVVATWSKGRASMERFWDDYGERIVSLLQPVSVEVQPNALGSDGIAMNVAFLVEKANLEAFNVRARQLKDLFYNQIDLRVISPLPAYSFATVEVIRPSPEKIEEARRLLKLSEPISELEVRKAFRHLAVETHPAPGLGEKLAKKRSAALRRASDLLIAYCRSQAEPESDFWINIRRSRSDEVQLPRLVEVEA